MVLQVAEVYERYQSFNMEMCEVVGGKFWIPQTYISFLPDGKTGRYRMLYDDKTIEGKLK